MIRYNRKRILIFLVTFLFLGLYTILMIPQVEQREEEDSLRQELTYSEPPLRILVLSYNRSTSLEQCLDSLQHLELDGSEGLIEIWIDRSVSGTVDQDVLRIARSFYWKKGHTNIYIQEHHVGIYGQWINTWKPSEDSQEIAIILEDDIDLSPYAFRWLKEAHKHYDGENNIAGYGLSDIEIPLNSHDEFLVPSGDEVVFKFPRFSTFGFSPKANVWREFQNWYNERVKSKTFKPYTKSDSLFTSWFKIFEKKKSSSSMWSIWFIKFCSEHKLYTLYANPFKYLTKHFPDIKNGTNLAFHRREVGLHFFGEHVRASHDLLLQTWYPELIKFPSETVIYAIPPPPKKKMRVIKRVVSRKNILKNVEN